MRTCVTQYAQSLGYGIQGFLGYKFRFNLFHSYCWGNSWSRGSQWEVKPFKSICKLVGAFPRYFLISSMWLYLQPNLVSFPKWSWQKTQKNINHFQILLALALQKKKSSWIWKLPLIFFSFSFAINEVINLSNKYNVGANRPLFWNKLKIRVGRVVGSRNWFLR